mgnify:CR=1 FL=1
MQAAVKKIIKKVVGKKSVGAFQRAVGALRKVFMRLALANTFFLKVFFIFSSSFNREAASVIAGRLDHDNNREGEWRVNYHLRRSIHRLEKGLSMRPRKSVFAEDIIADTVDSFVSTLRNGGELDEITWAHDVLEEYFSVCDGTKIVRSARAAFEEALRELPLKRRAKEKLIPFMRKNSVQQPVTYEGMLALSKRRRSVRWYRPEPVPRELIDLAVEIAALSPSACNRQPFYFRVFDDPELLKKTRHLPMGIKGFAENIPVMVAVVGQLRAYPEPRDRHVIYVDGGLAAMSFMYALETLGLGSCPVNWPDIEERERQAEDILGLNKDERIVMWISLGYPCEEGVIPRSDKLSINTIRIYN